MPVFGHIHPEEKALPLSKRFVEFSDRFIRNGPAAFMKFEKLFPAPAVDAKVIVSSEEFENISGCIRTDALYGADFLEQLSCRSGALSPGFGVDIVVHNSFRQLKKIGGAIARVNFLAKKFLGAIRDGVRRR